METWTYKLTIKAKSAPVPAAKIEIRAAIEKDFENAQKELEELMKSFNDFYNYLHFELEDD